MTPREALAKVLVCLQAERRNDWSDPQVITDAALAALEAALDASEARAADIRDALERGCPDDAERALARFGAAVAWVWWLEPGESGGFRSARGDTLDGLASRSGAMGRNYKAAPGIADAVDRLLAGGEVDDG